MKIKSILNKFINENKKFKDWNYDFKEALFFSWIGDG
jgi:hypothetical protein